MTLTQTNGIKLFLIINFLITMTMSFAQCSNFSVYSKVLNEHRDYSVFLPDDENVETLPIIYTLDGLGAMTYGVNQVNAKFGRSINAIVIEIESTDRWKDFATNPNGGFGKNSDLTRRFFAEEFFPMIDSIYPKSIYRVAVGHSLTALFWNNLITKNPEYIDALVSISPMATDSTLVNINSAYKRINKDLRLYFSYAEDDLSGHEKSYKSVPKRDKFSKISYDIERINNTTHTTLLPQSIHNGLIHVFYDLQELDRYSKKEIKKLYLSHVDSVDFIESYYSRIENTYGLKLPYRKSDILAVPFFIQKWGKPEYLIAYCEKYLEQNSGFWQLYFYKGEYYEQEKDYQKALDNYEEGYKLILIENEILNKSDYEEIIIRVKKKIANN